MTVVWLFLAMQWSCLQFKIVVFSDHTYLLFLNVKYNFDSKALLQQNISEPVFGPRREKTSLGGVRQSEFQTSLFNYRDKLEN